MVSHGERSYLTQHHTDRTGGHWVMLIQVEASDSERADDNRDELIAEGHGSEKKIHPF
jgi:hypothetical protein